MCGRTALFAPQDVLESNFEAVAVSNIRRRYNISPNEDLAVITNDSPSVIETHKWGFLPEWVTDPSNWHHPINARSETLSTNSTFNDAYRNRRCVVLTNGFYEWEECSEGSNQPYFYSRTDRRPFAMAGLWSEWESESGDLKKTTVTIITTDANDTIGKIHDRMPVILLNDTWRDWLRFETTDSIYEPPSASDFEMYPVSKRVNDPSNDGPKCIEPHGDRQSDLNRFI